MGLAKSRPSAAPVAPREPACTTRWASEQEKELASERVGIKSALNNGRRRQTRPRRASHATGEDDQSGWPEIVALTNIHCLRRDPSAVYICIQNSTSATTNDRSLVSNQLSKTCCMKTRRSINFMRFAHAQELAITSCKSILSTRNSELLLRVQIKNPLAIHSVRLN